MIPQCGRTAFTSAMAQTTRRSHQNRTYGGAE